MSLPLEAVTLDVVRLALDAASLRQEAISTNLANASTPGYVPMSVSFEDQLADARRSLETSGRVDEASLQGVQPTLQQSVGSVPARTLIDMEAASLAHNAVHYQALLKGLSRHYQILSSAVSDGKH
jgi:flagellar basal-body rod protein FlgB